MASASDDDDHYRPSHILQRVSTLNVVLERLRDTGGGKLTLEEFQLPQIMFVSDHRHGATSVLQSMLGLRFMPGAGSPFEDTVDREELVLNKPLEIEIRPTASNEMQPYVRFPDIDASRRVTDFAEVAARIQTHFVPFPAATAGGQGELFGGDLVEATALRMTLYSPSLPSMTVVQLPGLCQLPADYANSVEALVRKYADNENSILVAVVAGDGDVNNSNAMRVCKSVDPGGQRTVGVLTKLDNLNLAEEESNAFQQSLLLNNGAGSNFPLPQHGWIGVLGDFPSRVWINYRRDSAMAQAVEPEPEEKWGPGPALARRSTDVYDDDPDDTHDDAAWYERLHEVEQLFFATHREYKEEAHKSCGVGLLKDKLTGILVARVQERVPEFAKSIRATRAGPLMTIRQDLNPLVDESKMSDKLMEVASLLKDEWSYQVDGLIGAQHGKKQRDIGIERVMHKIEEVYKKLNKVLIREPGTELEQHVGYALQQTEWFPERQVWQRCCQFVLDPMVKPCCDAVDDIVLRLQAMVKATKTSLVHCRAANDYILNHINEHLDKYKNECIKFVRLLVQLEGYYPNFQAKKVVEAMDRFCQETNTQTLEASSDEDESAVIIQKLARPAQYSAADICQVEGCGAYLPTLRLPSQRHHCRFCGITVCGPHSEHTESAVERLPPVRVCDPCHKVFEASRNPELAKAQAAKPTVREQMMSLLEGGSTTSPIIGEEEHKGDEGAITAVGDAVADGNALGRGSNDDNSRGLSDYDSDGGVTSVTLLPGAFRDLELTPARQNMIKSMGRVIRVYASSVGRTILDQIRKSVQLLILERARADVFYRLEARFGFETSAKNQELRDMMVLGAAPIHMEIRRLERKVRRYNRLLLTLSDDFGIAVGDDTEDEYDTSASEDESDTGAGAGAGTGAGAGAGAGGRRL